MIDFCGYPMFTNQGQNSGLFDFPRRSLFDDIFSTQMIREAEYQRQRQLERERIKMFREMQPLVRELEDANKFQIQLFKRKGSFAGYEVKIVKYRDGSHRLKLTGNSDGFEREYYVDPRLIDSKNINWRWFSEENVLILTIKKTKIHSHSRRERKLKDTSRSRRRASRTAARKEEYERGSIAEEKAFCEESPLEKSAEQLHDSDSSVCEEALSDGGSSTEPIADSSSDFSADSSLESSSDDHKHSSVVKRKPTIEEVEDEEFVLLRKNALTA
ncbi:Piso0_000201 [Millerozyma farinosa CBS 7064]|uniref:Piso0_000201 protein n=1 Tax=Pichia sorbitophila (strain ATCC MYA-4447 / BCRC 22081 / CBS 7064 / NBRC 10061 / NRRL Y-12695) TaxID=559304 RepID=G8YTC7_PICSO|nr:Piso0_000201 [Millerozyma farinosa CBS 7064]